MNILPINNTSFKGTTIPFTYKRGENELKTIPYFHKDSSIERTIGAFHSEPRNKVYFANPMEFVPDNIKDSVDFVVYDNEPSYPKIEDLEKNYFGNKRINYREDFENIREYYYRREMGGFANNNDAKYQQWQAAECTRLYDEAGDLRYKKENAEDAIKALEKEKTAIISGINNTDKEIKNQFELKKAIEEHIETLEKVEKCFSKVSNTTEKGISNEIIMHGSAASRVNDAAKKEAYKKAIENSAYYNSGIEQMPYDGLKYGKYENTTLTYEAINNAQKSTESIAEIKKVVDKKNKTITNSIKTFKKILEDNSQTINEMKSYLDHLIKLEQNIETKIKDRKVFVEACKEKLKPLFENLKNFYGKQGIKVIKK